MIKKIWRGTALSFLLGVRAYCNLVASVYMHDRLLARLLPAYGVFYISSLTTIAPPSEVGQTSHQGEGLFLYYLHSYSSATGERWSCIRRVFETPRGLLMGQKFLRNFIDALGSWNSSKV